MTVNAPPRTIAFFLPSLAGGGAQRTVLHLVNRLNRDRFRPILILATAEGPYLALLRADVPIIDLSTPSLRRAVPALARALLREAPDLVFATMWPANIVLALARSLARLDAPMVLRESNNPTASRTGVALPYRVLARWAYHSADTVVALSHGVSDDLANRYALPREQIVTIHNPIDTEAIRELARERAPECDLGESALFEIVAVGRLVPQKGFDLLLDAVARLDTVPWRLTILGEGPMESDLRKRARDLGIDGAVRFKGFRENPYAWMARADLFVLSSRWEGFGHVVAEAMACGTAVLASDCRSGPSEIVTDTVDGLLYEAGSVEALAEGLQRAAMDSEERARLAAAGLRSVQRFDFRTIIPRYEEVFLAQWEICAAS